VVFDTRLSFAHTDDVYSLMENIATVAVPEIHSSDNGASTTYPSLNRFSSYLLSIYGIWMNDGYIFDDISRYLFAPCGSWNCN